jgi:hypothetical protein
MCCQRFGAEVLLANIYGSPEYKENTGIPIQGFMENYCRYLDNILPGCNFYRMSEDDIDDYVKQSKYIFAWEDELKKILLAKSKPEREKYNQQYPKDTDEKLQFAADVCLIAFTQNPKKKTVDS